ncbi:hypothetical protein I316_06767 [Kwoniella heveanensis BCC8398]|uniref:Mid2 domain-containing protein n=1 Tax=Kwoniella heveanensis BCC8398 TaxID=1296120 RepID=A0A1B9GKR1_9TREE|nr:hypothetical protein I316_06767 [Kwoniella heveanensis BCC8398]
MRLSAALPLILLPLGLAHSHSAPLQPAHHPSRRFNVAQGSSSREIHERQHSGGLLGGLVDDDETTTPGGSTIASTTIRSTTIPASTTSPSTSSSVDNVADDDDTSTLVSSRVTSTSIHTPLMTSSSSNAISSGSSIDPATSLNSTSAVSSSISTEAANSTTTVAESSSSVAPSSAAMSTESIQTTVDEAGQTQLVTVIFTEAASATDAAATASTSAAKKDDGDSIPTAAIIGISVGAGVVVLVLIAFAVWRMKRRNGDEDEAIRWPELNRHGDSDAHHALPARQTGQHGFETNPLSRSLSNSSSIFAPSSLAPPQSVNGGPVPMALNGSSFGATSSLEDEYSEKQAAASYDDHENYTSLPPPLQMHQGPGGVDYPPAHGHSPLHEDDDPYGGMPMANANDQHVTLPNLHPPQGNYRIE